MAALALAASAAEPPAAALKDLAPTGKLRVTFIVSNAVQVVKDAAGFRGPAVKGRAAGLAYVEAFVADAKASGLVAEAISRAGLRGVNVAL